MKVLRRFAGSHVSKAVSCDGVPCEETIRVEVTHEGARHQVLNDVLLSDALCCWLVSISTYIALR